MRHSWLKILSKLPLGVHHFFADWLIYPLVYYVVRYRRRMVDKNMMKAFPDWSQAERDALRKRFYHQFADLIVETVWGYGASDAQMREHMQYIDEELLVNACHEGGAFTMLSHLGTWEWMADFGRRHQHEGIQECNVYRRLKSKYNDRLMLDIRSKRGGECVEKDLLLRRMVQISKSDMKPMYGMLSDQKPSPRNAHMWTTFLNQETSFLNGTEVLSKKFGYKCFYGYIRSPKRGYYTMTFIPMDADNITEQYARLLEQNILEQPHLWLWTHNRWKHQRPKIQPAETENAADQKA